MDMFITFFPFKWLTEPDIELFSKIPRFFVLELVFPFVTPTWTFCSTNVSTLCSEKSTINYVLSSFTLRLIIIHLKRFAIHPYIVALFGFAQTICQHNFLSKRQCRMTLELCVINIWKTKTYLCSFSSFLSSTHR